MKTLRKLARLVVSIVLVVLLYKAAMWTYDSYRKADAQAQQQEEILDVDKECWKQPDTGQCLCRHARTGDRLFLDYDECNARASGQK